MRVPAPRRLGLGLAGVPCVRTTISGFYGLSTVLQLRVILLRVIILRVIILRVVIHRVVVNRVILLRVTWRKAEVASL